MAQRPSPSAAHQNDEVLLVIRPPLLAAHFTREMDRLWKGAELGVTERLKRKLLGEQEAVWEWGGEGVKGVWSGFGGLGSGYQGLLGQTEMQVAAYSRWSRQITMLKTARNKRQTQDTAKGLKELAING